LILQKKKRKKDFEKRNKKEALESKKNEQRNIGKYRDKFAKLKNLERQ